MSMFTFLFVLDGILFTTLAVFLGYFPEYYWSLSIKLTSTTTLETQLTLLAIHISNLLAVFLMMTGLLCLLAAIWGHYNDSMSTKAFRRILTAYLSMIFGGLAIFYTLDLNTPAQVFEETSMYIHLGVSIGMMLFNSLVLTLDFFSSYRTNPQPTLNQFQILNINNLTPVVGVDSNVTSPYHDHSNHSDNKMKERLNEPLLSTEEQKSTKDSQNNNNNKRKKKNVEHVENSKNSDQKPSSGQPEAEESSKYGWKRLIALAATEKVCMYIISIYETS